MTVPPSRAVVPVEYDLSLVLAVHDQVDTLPDVLAALDGQRGVDLSRVEVVAVDDGSTDGSLTLLRDWQERSPIAVTVLTTAPAGRAAARNYGLDQATGRWIGFPRPDRPLPADRLHRLLAAAAAQPAAELVAADPVAAELRSGGDSARHVVRLLDLRRTPWRVPTRADQVLLRRARLEALGLRLATTLRPGSEDADLCARYLLGLPEPLVAVLATGDRGSRPADESGAIGGRGGRRDPGLVQLLELGAARTGRPPEWLQVLVIAELARIVGADGGPPPARAADSPDPVALLRELRPHLDRHVIAAFSMLPLDDAWRQVLLDGLGDRPWRSDQVVVTGRDDAEELIRVAVRFTGAEPDVEYLVAGVPVTPLHTKVRTHSWLGHPLLAERIAWLPSDGPLRVRVDGRYAQIATRWPQVEPADVDPLTLPAAATSTAAADPGRRTPRRRRLRERWVKFTAWSRTRVARRDQGAWVLHLPAPGPGRDAVLALADHLRQARPDVDYRLAVLPGPAADAGLPGREGSRPVTVGSRRWRRLAAAPGLALVSTDPDAGRLLPAARFVLLCPAGDPTDLGSVDLPGPTTRLVVTADPAGHAAVVGDGTPSELTTKEVRLVPGLEPAALVAVLEDRRVVAGIALGPTPAVSATTPMPVPAVMPTGPTTPQEGITVRVARRPPVPAARAADPSEREVSVAPPAR